MKKNNELLLNTRMIFAFFVVELLALLALDGYVYQQWKNVKLELLRKNLVAQVELLSQKATLKSNLPFIFQVVSENQKIIWDSLDPSRIGKKLAQPYFLLSHALQTPIQNDLIEFGDYYGYFTKNTQKIISLGAVSKKSIEPDQFQFIEQIFFMNLIITSLSLMLMIILTARIAAPWWKLKNNFEILAKDYHLLANEDHEKVNPSQKIELVSSDRIETERYEIESYYHPAEVTGGDYWGHIETPHSIVLYIADATGHGHSSAMLASASKGCFSAIQKLLIDEPHIKARPSFFLHYANQAILDTAHDELHMTMFIAVYSFQEKKLYYSSAGHNPAFVFNASKIITLQGLGSRLGENNFTPSPEKSIAFDETDTLFLYTDGLLDCANEHDIALGRKNVKKQILSSVQKQFSLSKTKQSLISKIKEHAENKPLADDISFTLFRIKKARVL